MALIYPTAPAAPTNVVLNDTTKTLTITKNPLFPLDTDYEYTDNGLDGAGLVWYRRINSFPVQIGSYYCEPGQIGVRVRGKLGVNIVSATTYNTSGLTPAGTVSGQWQRIKIVSANKGFTLSGFHSYSGNDTGTLFYPDNAKQFIPEGANGVFYSSFHDPSFQLGIGLTLSTEPNGAGTAFSFSINSSTELQYDGKTVPNIQLTWDKWGLRRIGSAIQLVRHSPGLDSNNYKSESQFIVYDTFAATSTAKLYFSFSTYETFRKIDQPKYRLL